MSKGSPKSSPKSKKNKLKGYPKSSPKSKKNKLKGSPKSSPNIWDLIKKYEISNYAKPIYYHPDPTWDLIKKYQISNYNYAELPPVKNIGNLNISYYDRDFFLKNDVVNTSENDVIIYDDDEIVYAINGKFNLDHRDSLLGLWEKYEWELENKYEDDSSSSSSSDDLNDDERRELREDNRRAFENQHYDEFSSIIKNVTDNFEDYIIKRIFIKKSAWNRLVQKKRLLLLNLGSIENIYIFEKISSMPFSFFINLYY
jgi:hypothetical protein